MGTKALFDLNGFFRTDSGSMGRFNGDSMFSRNAYVGLQNDRYGALKLGRNTTPYFVSTILFNPLVDSYVFSPMIFHTYFGANNDPLLRADAYSLHNARLTWVSPQGDWEAAVFATNLTDERAITSKLNFLSLFGTVETTYTRPEEWAMSIKKHF